MTVQLISTSTSNFHSCLFSKSTENKNCVWIYYFPSPYVGYKWWRVVKYLYQINNTFSKCLINWETSFTLIFEWFSHFQSISWVAGIVSTKYIFRQERKRKRMSQILEESVTNSEDEFDLPIMMVTPKLDW